MLPRSQRVVQMELSLLSKGYTSAEGLLSTSSKETLKKEAQKFVAQHGQTSLV